MDFFKNDPYSVANRLTQSIASKQRTQSQVHHHAPRTRRGVVANSSFPANVLSQVLKKESNYPTRTRVSAANRNEYSRGGGGGGSGSNSGSDGSENVWENRSSGSVTTNRFHPHNRLSHFEDSRSLRTSRDNSNIHTESSKQYDGSQLLSGTVLRLQDSGHSETRSRISNLSRSAMLENRIKEKASARILDKLGSEFDSDTDFEDFLANLSSDSSSLSSASASSRSKASTRSFKLPQDIIASRSSPSSYSSQNESSSDSDNILSSVRFVNLEDIVDKQPVEQQREVVKQVSTTRSPSPYSDKSDHFNQASTASDLSSQILLAADLDIDLDTDIQEHKSKVHTPDSALPSLSQSSADVATDTIAETTINEDESLMTENFDHSSVYSEEFEHDFEHISEPQTDGESVSNNNLTVTTIPHHSIDENSMFVDESIVDEADTSHVPTEWEDSHVSSITVFSESFDEDFESVASAVTQVPPQVTTHISLSGSAATTSSQAESYTDSSSSQMSSVQTSSPSVPLKGHQEKSDVEQKLVQHLTLHMAQIQEKIRKLEAESVARRSISVQTSTVAGRHRGEQHTRTGKYDDPFTGLWGMPAQYARRSSLFNFIPSFLPSTAERELIQSKINHDPMRAASESSFNSQLNSIRQHIAMQRQAMEIEWSNVGHRDCHYTTLEETKQFIAQQRARRAAAARKRI